MMHFYDKVYSIFLTGFLLTLIIFDRTKNSFIHKWWFGIDKPILYTTMLLLFIGFLLVMTASPYVANRIDVSTYYFIIRQAVYIGLFLIIMYSISLVSYARFHTLIIVLSALGILGLLLVLVDGTDIKGAKRWVYLLGLSIQPSEFVKILLPVVTAIIMDKFKYEKPLIRIVTLCAPYLVVTVFLLLQPDFGMTILNSVVFFIQFLILGISYIWIAILIVMLCLLVMIAYITFPHVSARIDSFFGDSAGYQISRAVEAFKNGGFSGVGPGRGVVKEYLPDAHTDFIFSVLGEEFGTIGIIALLCMYGYLVYRVVLHIYKSKNVLTIMALSGLISVVSIQVLIHVASNMNLIPTKGMTLPLVSYGGSSMLAMGLCFGILLLLTKNTLEDKNNIPTKEKVKE